jgi:sugar transferase (PEP-CTERM/EpsH1 system associated)
MKDLLFLSHRIPYPPDKGEKIRAWHIFRHLARSFRIHLGCFVDDPEDAAHISDLRSFCADLTCIPINRRTQQFKALLRFRPGAPLTLGYFHDPRLQRWVDSTITRHQIQHAFVYSSAMAPFMMPHAMPARILDMVDVDSTKWSSYATTAAWPARAVYAREGRTLLRFERRAAQAFTHTIFVSEAEWRHFAALAPESRDRTGWIDNGVDLSYFSPDGQFPDPFHSTAPPGAPRLVFTGRMDYRPNIEGVTWFAKGVMPILRARHPEASFAIVGAAPTAEVEALAGQPGIIVTGRVADTRPWLAHASIVVAPLLTARGIQNKILEGMAMGRPVIATPEAFEGVQATPEQDILVASGVDQTIARIQDVLSGRYQGLGAAARQAMMRHHDWSATLTPLDTLFGTDLPRLVAPESAPSRPALPSTEVAS